MSGPPGTSRPSQPTPGTAPTPPPRRQRTLPTPEELRSPPASRETWAADDSVTGGSRGSLPPGAGYAHNTSGVKPVRPRGVEEAVDMLVTRKNHSPSSSYPINLLSSVPELRHTVLDDGSTPRTSPILLSVSSPSSSPKLNRPGLSAGILSAPVLATSRFNSLPPLRHSASTERPTSSFFPNSTLPPATASPRSASPFEYGSPRRSFASPPLQQVGEQFIATPSINDSYAPQEQPERIETLRERNHRASLIPSFVPAPAFSSGDRGPYPPHQQRISALSPAMSVLRRTSTNSLSKETTSNDYFVGVGMGQEGVGAYRSGQTLELVRSLSSTKAKGKGKETDVLEEEPEEEEVSPPGWRSSTFVAPAAMNNIPVDMVGVGRNSFLGPVNPNAVPTSPKGNTLSPPPNPLVMASPTQPILSPFLPQPSVCVECMMRDRDMVDIDVTGVDIWERESDAELKEGLLREAEEDAALEQEGEGSGSEENRRRGGETRSIRHSGAPRSSWSIKPPSSSAHSSSLNTGSVVSGGRRRLGLGQPLTAASLKLWTSMNIPAATHRYKTLRLFLAESNSMLDPVALELQWESTRRRRSTARSLEPPQAAPARQRASTSLSRPPVFVEHNNEQESLALNTAANAVFSSRSRIKKRDPGEEEPREVRTYASGDQPWLSPSSRRLSAPGLRESIYSGASTSSPSSSAPGTPTLIGSNNYFGYTRSTTDLRSSPATDSRRASLWSKFRGATGSTSVLSLAASGSMMDMHLGLSIDKHNEVRAQGGPYEQYGAARSDPLLQRSYIPQDREAGRREPEETPKKKKKKGLRGFFSKLISPGTTPQRPTQHVLSASAPAPMGYRLDDSDDEYPLAPPPPLSLLANEPRLRTPSAVSSADSLPLPQLHHSRGYSAPTGARSASFDEPRPLYSPDSTTVSLRNEPIGGVGADRLSIVTRSGSYTSARSMLAGPSQFEMVGGSPPRKNSLPLSISAAAGASAGDRRPSGDYLVMGMNPFDPAHAHPSYQPPSQSQPYQYQPTLYQQQQPSSSQRQFQYAPDYIVSSSRPLSTSAPPMRTDKSLPAPPPIFAPDPAPSTPLTTTLSTGLDQVGGGKNSKARAKVFMLPFAHQTSGNKKRDHKRDSQADLDGEVR